MADYLIQESTLDAIVRAINDKAGTQVTMTPAQMVTAISNIPSGSGGMSWELIADYTSDAAAEVVMATIPSGKQDANIYRVHFKCDTAIYYGKAGINSNYAGYSGSTTWDCDVYITKSIVGTNATSGTSAAGNYSMSAPITGSSNYGVLVSGPLVSVGMQAFQSSQPIPAGLNIKVWRLVES